MDTSTELNSVPPPAIVAAPTPLFSLLTTSALTHVVPYLGTEGVARVRSVCVALYNAPREWRLLTATVTVKDEVRAPVQQFLQPPPSATIRIAPIDVRSVEAMVWHAGLADGDAVLQHCEYLRRVTISGNERVGVYGERANRNAIRSAVDVALIFQLMAQRCPHLTHLNLNGADDVTDELLSLVAANPQLQDLDVTHTTRITDASMILVAQHCRALRRLNIGSTGDRITDASIAVVARNCLMLQYLNVSYTERITDASMILVAQHCRALRNLNVWGTKDRITDASLNLIRQQCPRAAIDM